MPVSTIRPRCNDSYRGAEKWLGLSVPHCLFSDTSTPLSALPLSRPVMSAPDFPDLPADIRAEVSADALPAVRAVWDAMPGDSRATLPAGADGAAVLLALVGMVRAFGESGEIPDIGGDAIPTGAAVPLPDAVRALIPEAERDAVLTFWHERMTPDARAFLAGARGHAFVAQQLQWLARGWDPLAPLNRGPDGTLYRKVAFPTPEGGREWMWARVASQTATAGVLANVAHHAPNAREGTRVQFTHTPDGFAEASGWLTLDSLTPEDV